MSERVNLTELIHRAQEGDAEAADALFAATYHDLRGLAKARLYASGPRATLDTLSLVHESYLRFTASGQLRLEDRVHFMRWAGRVMRSVIVDFARRRNAERRPPTGPCGAVTYRGDPCQLPAYEGQPMCPMHSGQRSPTTCPCGACRFRRAAPLIR